MKVLILLLCLAAPVAADSISSGATFTLSGAKYSTDGVTFTDASSLSPVYVPAGTVEVLFVGTITNNDTTAGDYLYLNNQSASLPAYLTLDTNTFFSNPGVLDPQVAGDDFYYYTGDIIGIQLDPATPAGIYNGSFSILGGAVQQTTTSGTPDGSQDIVGGSAQSFSIVVTPEPRPRWILLGSMAVMALLVRRRLTV